jgi:hypothetical protein
MNFKVKKDEETGEHFIDFEDVKCLFEDPLKIAYYSLETSEDGILTLQFFDENNNLITPGRNENTRAN